MGFYFSLICSIKGLINKVRFPKQLCPGAKADLSFSLMRKIDATSKFPEPALRDQMCWSFFFFFLWLVGCMLACFFIFSFFPFSFPLPLLFLSFNLCLAVTLQSFSVLLPVCQNFSWFGCGSVDLSTEITNATIKIFSFLLQHLVLMAFMSLWQLLLT